MGQFLWVIAECVGSWRWSFVTMEQKCFNNVCVPREWTQMAVLDDRNGGPLRG